MATFTENYNLIKPSEEDYYDVQDFNENMDAIDGQLAETAEEVDGIGNKIGTAADEGGETVFGKLNQICEGMAGLRLVKSIQRVTYAAPKGSQEGVCNISPVNPERCFVLLERLLDSAGSGVNSISYTLEETEIALSYSSYASTNGLKLGFWIIEFY